MRPINLKFTAFGPYPEPQEIDFTSLKNSNMFVITGPTGSGKTTIFDAMAFALYGSASGSDRVADMFRSDFSNDEVATEVVFEFEVHQKRFTITRMPSQFRPKKRGTGLRKIDASVKLQIDDKVYTAQSEVNLIIEQELGLTRDQFKQIVLLPQGEFKKLLVSNSKEKEIIFRKIFNTGHINQIQERLRRSSDQIKQEVEKCDIQIKTILRNYPHVLGVEQLQLSQVNTTSNLIEINQYLSEIELKQAEYNKQIETDASYHKDMELLRQVTNKLSEYQAQAAQYEEYNNFIENIPTLINIQNLKSEASKLSNQIASNQEQIKLLNTQLEVGNQQVASQTIRYTKIEAKYNQLDQMRDQLAADKKLLSQIELEIEMGKQLDKYKKLISDYDQQLVELETEKIKLEQTFSKLAENQQQFESNVTAIENYTAMINDNEKLLNVSVKIASLQAAINKQSAVANQYNQDLITQSNYLNELRGSFIRMQAGTLAKELKQGDSCPVCGSLEHPKLATIDENLVTNQDIQLQEAKVSKITTKLQTVLNGIEVDNALISQLETDNRIENVDYSAKIEKIKIKLADLQQINKKLATQIDQSELNMQTEQISERIQQCQSEQIKYKFAIDDLSSKLKLSAKTVNSYAMIKASIANQITLIKEIADEYKDITDNLVKLRSKIASIEAKLTLYDEQAIDLAEKSEACNSKINHLIRSFEPTKLTEYLKLLDSEADVRAKYNKYISDMIVLESQQQALATQTEKYQVIDIKPILRATEELTVIKQTYNSIVSQLTSYADRLLVDIKDLSKIEATTQKLNTEYQLIADVSDVANGKTTSKISFERYMLSIYFKQIITRANIYFRAMSANRYELEYKSPTSRVGPQGLDLNIIDNYTTKIRDVKSLSGGESFKAALSMALGLSDIVQMNSGGVQIDTIFIDEGFGSLDIDSLNSAIDTLISIESEGRMVGIISHVEELKNQINNRIVITPSPSGSKLTTFFN